MKKYVSLLIILSITIFGCKKNDVIESLDTLRLQATSYLEKDLSSSAVYFQQANTWAIKSFDPYKLSSFRNVLSSLSKDMSDTLSATHYALKIYPRTLEEQNDLERDSRINVAYLPFDYISLPDEINGAKDKHLIVSSQMRQEQVKY